MPANSNLLKFFFNISQIMFYFAAAKKQNTTSFTEKRNISNIKIFEVMTKAEIQERVTDIIVDRLGVSKSEVTENATFTQDLGADSLDTVELMMELERQFDVKIPDEVSEKIQTVGDVVELIAEQQA